VNAILAKLENWSQSVSKDTFLKCYGMFDSYQPFILNLSRCDALITPNQRRSTAEPWQHHDRKTPPLIRRKRHRIPHPQGY